MMKIVSVFIVISGLVLGTQALSAEEIILTPENAVFLTGEITPTNLMDVAKELYSNHKAEYLVIFSYGGDVDRLEAFSARVSTYPNLKVLVVYAASAAAAISQMVMNERLIVVSGEMMFHRIKTAFGPQSFAELSEWEKRIAEMRESDDHFARQCLRRMHVSRAVYDANTIGRDWVMSSFEAVKLGAAERIVTAKCDKRLKQKKSRWM